MTVKTDPLPRTLYMIRHAHAWDNSAGQRDVERELNTDGLKAAVRAGEWFKSAGIAPSVMITSSAVRAQSTAWLIAERISYPHEKIIKRDDLYEAPVRTMMEAVNSLQNSWDVAVIVAHNPTIHYFVEYVSGENLDGIAPGSICELKVDFDDWALVSEKTAELAQYVIPD